jgi:HD-like signal output (HDOD) protein
MAAISESTGSLFRRPNPVRVLRSQLNMLIEMLRAPETSLIKFGHEVAKHPAVLKPLMRAANSSLTGSAVEITEPAHAALYLGARRVEFLLSTLPPEIIEEDAQQLPDTNAATGS